MKTRQIAGRRFTFKCGCVGILPQRGKNNKFAKWGTGRGWVCRIAKIITVSQWDFKRRDKLHRDGQPINPKTSHKLIREMMKQKNCWRCGKSLVWEFGLGRTPHLHHNHVTGEPIGFTHSSCNPRAMEHEIDRLRKLLEEKQR